MKRLIIFLGGLIALTNCVPTQEEEITTMITGKIDHPLGEVVKVYNGDLLFSDSLDNEGYFAIQLEVDKPYFLQLKHGEYTTFYIRPGDSLHINLDTDQFDETVVYSGDGADLSQFCASIVLYNDTAVSFQNLMQLEESEFLEAIDQLEADYNQLLVDAGVKDELFVSAQKEIFKLVRGRHLLGYENAHQNLAESDSFKLSDDFYSSLEGIDINNEGSYDLFEFRRYISAYLDNQIADTYNKIEEPSEGDYYRLFMEAIEENITNPSIKKKLHYSQLNSYPFTYIDDETRTKWIGYFEALSPDSAKLAVIKEKQKEIDKLKPGNDAPGFSYVSIDGEMVSLEDLSGSYVYVDVWATWCGPCLRELPHLEKLQEEFKDSPVKFVSVSIDNSPEPWRKMVTKKEMKGIQLYAEGAWGSDIVKDYMIGGIPRFILIDPEGKIISSSARRPSGGIGEQLKELLKEV